MQSTVLRTAAARSLPRSAPITRLSKPAARRTFAQAQGDIGKAESGHTANSKIPIFAIGGVVIALVAGRYILASSKEARSGHAEQIEARRAGEITNRDPRDSPVKTLEQKKQKEQGS